jgi:hypothetical protein
MTRNVVSGRRRCSSFVEDSHPGGYAEIDREDAFLKGVARKRFHQLLGLRQRRRNSLGASGLSGPEAMELSDFCFKTFSPQHRALDRQHRRRLGRQIMGLAERSDAGIITFDDFSLWFQRQCQDIAIFRAKRASKQAENALKAHARSRSASSSSVASATTSSGGSLDGSYDPTYQPSRRNRPKQQDLDGDLGFEDGCVVVDLPAGSSSRRSPAGLVRSRSDSGHARRGHGARERLRRVPMLFSGDSSGRPGAGVRPVLKTGASKTARRRARKKHLKVRSEMERVMNGIEAVRYSPRSKGKGGRLGYFKPRAASPGTEGFVLLDEKTPESPDLSIEERDRARQVALINTRVAEKRRAMKHARLAKRAQEHDSVVFEVLKQQLGRDYSEAVADAARKAGARRAGGSARRAQGSRMKVPRDRSNSTGRRGSFAGRTGQPQSRAFQHGNRIRAN